MPSSPTAAPRKRSWPPNELDGLDVGDTVEGTVVKTSPDIRISRKLAKGKASLDLLRQMYENRLPVEGESRRAQQRRLRRQRRRPARVLPAVADRPRQDRQSRSVHRTSRYEFRVTELSDDGRRIVVSRAALLKEANASKAEETRRNIVPGAELTGTVKTITPFGAFVDLGGDRRPAPRFRDEPPPRHRSEGSRRGRTGSARQGHQSRERRQAHLALDEGSGARSLERRRRPLSGRHAVQRPHRPLDRLRPLRRSRAGHRRTRPLSRSFRSA